jgi:hypothetical protein
MKKALDALGVGSVVLSAERYRAMEERLNAKGKDKGPEEILFGSLRIEGEVKSTTGREEADLVFELEFRTDRADMVVPVPFKGVRFASALLNGAAPIWGPDPERLSVLVKEPRACKLRLTATVPITRVGNERRLVLERIPAAAVTALDLAVPGQVSQAVILGAGLIPIHRGAGPTRLQSAALGILSTLDLSWQVGEAAASAAAIEGDVRITLGDTSAQVEARLRPVPFSPLQLPWKVRLPAGATQLRAELVRTEALGSEPLILTRGADGLLMISSPYPTTALDFTQVSLRWQQSLDELKTTVPLGMCEVVEPKGRQQSGTITLTSPEEPTVMLRLVNLTVIDRQGPGSERDKRVTRYRYTQVPAGLDAIPLPPALTRGAVEYRLQHTLSVQDGAWALVTDLEVLRTVRTQLTTLELTWPADWEISRRVLFSPVIRELEHDTSAHRLRLVLDGKPPDNFTVRLEGVPVAQPASLAFSLPHLVTAQGTRGQRSVPVELLPRPERVKLDAPGWDLRLDPAAVGLREDDASEGLHYVVVSKPAVLAVTREARLPKYRCDVEAFCTAGVVQTRQHFELRWNGPVPRRLVMLVPQGVSGIQFQRRVPDTNVTESLRAVRQADDGSSTWESWTVDLPPGSGPVFHLLCLTDAPPGRPITIPVVRFADGQAVQEGPISAKCIPGSRGRIQVPDLPGWRRLGERNGVIELRGDSLDQLLAVELLPADPADATPLAFVRESHVLVSSDGSTRTAQFRWLLDSLRTTELPLSIGTSAGAIVVQHWTLDGQPQALESLVTTYGDSTTVRIPIPPRLLGQSVLLSITVQYPASLGTNLLRVPAVSWLHGSVVETSQRWRIEVDPGRWLLLANQPVDETQHSAASWFPVEPIPAGASTVLTFRGPEGGGGGWAVTVPRTVCLIVLSVIALGAGRALARKPVWLVRALYGLPVVMILLHLVAPTLAAVLLWGMLPGAGMALLSLGGERWLRHRRDYRPPVFQRGAATLTTVSSDAAPRSVVLAEAPTLVPETRSSL